MCLIKVMLQYFAILVISVSANNALSMNSYLQHSSVIYGIIASSRNANVSEVCRQDLGLLKYGIDQRQIWAMKVLDSSATKAAGFLYGNAQWFGNRDMCEALTHPFRLTMPKHYRRQEVLSVISEKSPIAMQYRVAYLQHNSPYILDNNQRSQILWHLGLCLPQACSTADAHHLMISLINSELFMEQQLYSMKPELVRIKSLQLSNDFYTRPSFILIILALSVIVLCILLPFVTTKRPIKNEYLNNNNNDVSEKLLQAEQCFVDKFLQCFDLQRNASALFSSEPINAANNIPFINGFRTFATAFVVSIHTTLFATHAIKDFVYSLSQFELIFIRLAPVALMIVDCFFILDGFLNTYAFFQKPELIEKIKYNSFSANLKQMFTAVSRRYSRFITSYIIIMLLSDVVFAYLNDVSKFHIIQPYHELCPKYWWRNILLIQSFFELNDMCLDWTWSLASQMQFYIVGTILLYAYAKYPRFIKSLALPVLIGLWYTHHNKFLSEDFSLDAATICSIASSLYINPLETFKSYLLGMIFAWLLVVPLQGKLQLSRRTLSVFWNSTCTILLYGVYNFINSNATSTQDTFFATFARIHAGLNWACMFLAAAAGVTCGWARILEHKVFNHFSRICYAVYLLNPLLIHVLTHFSKEPRDGDTLLWVTWGFGFKVLLYCSCIVFVLLVEMPVANLIKLLENTSMKKTKSN